MKSDLILLFQTLVVKKSYPKKYNANYLVSIIVIKIEIHYKQRAKNLLW